eukprot:146326_1
MKAWSRFMLQLILCGCDIFEIIPNHMFPGCSKTKSHKPKPWMMIKIVLFSASYYMLFKSNNNQQHVLNAIEVIGFIVSMNGFLMKQYAKLFMKRQMHFFQLKLKLDGKHKLVVDGPYSIVRHPLYSTSYIHAIGTIIFISNTPIYILGLLRLIRLLFLPAKIDQEENMLKKHFGVQYDQYINDVPYRLLPFVY